MAWRKHTLALICSATCVWMAGVLPVTASAAGNFDLRGEWSFSAVAASGPSATGACVIREMETTSGAFSGTCVLNGGALSAAISGSVSGTSATLTVTVTGAGLSYVVPSATIETTAPSISGQGIFYEGPVAAGSSPLSMTRTATLQEVQEREARELKERQEKEAKERELKAKEARELKERQEAEAKEREAREAKERQETETRAREAREAKERLEREAREVAEKSAAAKQAASGPVVALASVEPAVKTVAESRSGSISIKLSSPNAIAATGHFTLMGTTSSGKASGASGKAAGKHTVRLGSAAFAIAAYGSESVKLKLSPSAFALLKHHAKLAATLTIVTEASGTTSVTKTYSMVLNAPRLAKGKR